MRTLKKTLCLVLVLAMMVGLCAMGASAVTYDDYPDKDSIKHPQAVKVMTAIGVLQGDDRGFRGQDNLNRAEGATFYTKLCAQTGAGVPSFTDMAGYEWANGAVAFCENNNIIAGYGDGTFRPGNPISYVQWLKMGLVALGYDPVREGLVGDQWEINTIKLVNKLNLTKGIDNIADYNAPIPRDDAAQVGLNILQAGMVEYKGGLTVTTSDGTKVETGVQATPIENNAYDYRGFIGADVDDEDEYNRLEFCENYFPNLKRATRWDDFGYPTYNWFMGKNRNDNTWMESKEIAVEMMGGVLAEYDTPATVTLGTVYTDSGWNASDDLWVLENGNSSYLGANDITLKANDKTRLTQYAGATAILVDVDEDGEADWLAVKYAYPATVTAVTEAAKSKSGNREVTLKVYNNADGVTVTGWESDDLNKFDVVMAYHDGTIAETGAAEKLELLAVEPAESAKGTLSKIGLYNGIKTTLTIDGVLYPVGAATLANMGVVPGVTVNGSELVVSKTYTVYMNNGCVLGIAGEAASYDNYVFVVGSTYKGAVDVTKPDAAKTADTGIVKQDGTTEVLTSTSEIAKAWYTTLTVGGVTTFTSADKGTIAKNATATLAAGTKIQKDKPALASNIVTDSKTVFVFYTGATGGYKTYTGIANVPSYELKNAAVAYALVGVSDGMAKAVFINLAGEEPTNVSTEKIFILSGEPSSTAFDDTTKKTLNVFPAVIDGAFGSIQTTMTKDDMAKFVGKVVTPTRDDTGSYIKALTEVTKNIAKDPAFETAKGITVSNGTITFAGRAWTTSDSTQIFYWDSAISTKNVEAGALTDLIGLGKTDAAVAITGVYSATSDTLSAIYVINAPKA